MNVQSSNPALGYEPGLLAGGMAGNLNSTTPNNGSFGVDPLGPSYSESKSSPPWAGNWTIVYTGQIFDEDGKVSFTENIDDKAWLKVTVSFSLMMTVGIVGQRKASTLVKVVGSISNSGCLTEVVAQVLRSPGFGYDPDGGNNYSLLDTDGQMDLFRVPGYDLSTLDTTEAGTFTFTYTSRMYSVTLPLPFELLLLPRISNRS